MTTTPEPLSAGVPEDLVAFLNEPRDSREYRRGVAVKLALQQVPYAQICALLDVTPGFVSQQKQAYLTAGVAGLRLKYHGAKPFLNPTAHAAVIAWLQAGQQWSLRALQQYLEQTYQVVFRSDQSYYDLFAEAGIRYKKSQARNPKQDPDQIAAKKTIS
jgi:putative transposase